MIVGVPKETYPGERRVALVPSHIGDLTRKTMECRIESGAGLASGYPDDDYIAKGAKVVSRLEVFDQSDVIMQVRAAGANPEAGVADLERMRTGQTVLGLLDPLWRPDGLRGLLERKITAFSLDLMPRSTRAQAMDPLSSMATVAGYKAVLLAADHLLKMFPLLMTAAGTVTPAKVFVLGAGVAGLQAIAVARRLGAVVQAYDIRPAVKQEVESVGGRFIELPLETGQTQQAGAYAQAMDEDFYRRQREMMKRVVSESDVVITTAAIPGKKSPVLITAEMVRGMAPGSVIVDLGAERGGNCELTRPDERVEVDGVIILGPTNLAAEVPYHASQLYSKNIVNFLLHLVPDGTLVINLEDPITRETLVTREGTIVQPKILELMK